MFVVTDTDKGIMGVYFSSINRNSAYIEVNIHDINAIEDAIYFIEINGLENVDKVYNYGSDHYDTIRCMFPDAQIENVHNLIQKLQPAAYCKWARKHGRTTKRGDVSYKLEYVCQWIKRNVNYKQAHNPYMDIQDTLLVMRFIGLC